ncbi:MAG: enoyl-CoA hydratase/isomerase family protein [Actinomycetota bacterium]|nr:enoyl-CoA hydratase/isomerase family protein [Actinomycetota bacterium]
MARKAKGDLILQEDPVPGVRVLTLNQPDIRNAMTAELTEAWDAAIVGVRRSQSLRCVVLAAAGRVFCAGADLSWLDQGRGGETTPDQLRQRMLPFYRSWLDHRSLAVPIIAAVNGPAIGAGLCLMLACDLRYASPAARFRAPFAQLGTHAGLGAGWLLKEAIGTTRTKELLYTGRELSAEEALQWGLVTDVADDVYAKAVEVATSIAEAAPIAVRLTKAGLSQLSDGVDSALEWEALAQAVTLASDDIHEGIRAVRERRRPKFLSR